MNEWEKPETYTKLIPTITGLILAIKKRKPKRDDDEILTTMAETLLNVVKIQAAQLEKEKQLIDMVKDLLEMNRKNSGDIQALQRRGNKRK
jgi:hypothetical protein